MKKGIAVLAAGLMLAGSLTGCGKGNTLDGTQTVAVMDETTNVPLGEVSLLLRYQQAQMESYYGSMLGMTNVYGQDLSGTGTIYGETRKAEPDGAVQPDVCAGGRGGRLWRGADR